MPARVAALAAAGHTDITLMVAGGGSLAVDTHEECAADLRVESTALHLWAAGYRFNLLLGLLAGRLRVRRFREAVSLTLRASNSFTSLFPTLRNATRFIRFWPDGVESPTSQWATAGALTPTSRAMAIWLTPRRRRKLPMSRGESRAAFASASDTRGIAGEASMSRFQPFAL